MQVNDFPKLCELLSNINCDQKSRFGNLDLYPVDQSPWSAAGV